MIPQASTTLYVTLIIAWTHLHLDILLAPTIPVALKTKFPLTQTLTRLTLDQMKQKRKKKITLSVKQEQVV